MFPFYERKQQGEDFNSSWQMNIIFLRNTPQSATNLMYNLNKSLNYRIMKISHLFAK